MTVCSERLELIPMSADFLRASLRRDTAVAQGLIQASLPIDWPDISDVLAFFLRKLENEPSLEPWLARSMVLRSSRTMSSTQASVRDCCLAFTFGWAENMVGAAVKSVPLGQSAGQRILATLANDIPAAVDYAIALQDSQRQAFSPMLAILSSQHETQYSRLFRS